MRQQQGRCSERGGEPNARLAIVVCVASGLALRRPGAGVGDQHRQRPAGKIHAD